MTPPFGRDAEYRLLAERLAARQGFLLHGPAGIGKTTLMKSLLPDFPAVLYCPAVASREAAFAALWAALRRVRPALAARNPATAPAIASRGRVRDALGAGHYTVVLDHLRRPSLVAANALRKLTLALGTPLVVIARTPHMEDLGALYSLYPGSNDRLALDPWPPEIAGAFFDQAFAAEQRPANWPDFRRQALAAAAGNPGALLGILSLARDQRYRRADHLLFAPLYIDLCLGRGAHSPQANHARPSAAARKAAAAGTIQE